MWDFGRQLLLIYLPDRKCKIGGLGIWQDKILTTKCMTQSSFRQGYKLSLLLLFDTYLQSHLTNYKMFVKKHYGPNMKSNVILYHNVRITAIGDYGYYLH